MIPLSYNYLAYQRSADGSLTHICYGQPLAATPALPSHRSQAAGGGAGEDVAHARRGPALVPRPAALREKNYPDHRQEIQQTAAVTMGIVLYLDLRTFVSADNFSEIGRS